MLSLIRQYQDPATRAAAWKELCSELTLIRRDLPARLWYRFDKDDSTRGFREAQQAIDARLAELLSPYEGRTEGVLPWLYGRIRNLLGSRSGFWKQLAPTASNELQEEQLTPDESREIEAPAGASAEQEQLWDGTLNPFDWLEKHRGRGIKEIDYQILIRVADSKTSTQIAAELNMRADAVRQRLTAFRKNLPR